MVVNLQSYPITSLHRVSPCDEGYVYIPVVFVAMLYIVYLVECYHCNTRFELMYSLNASSVYTHIEQMRESQPIIWWKAVSYHYIRRSRQRQSIPYACLQLIPMSTIQVTRYRNGDAYTTAQIYYERINTHVTGSCFSYGSCGVKDISKKLLDLELHPITKIRFTKGFAFANIESANEFEEQRSNFFEDNERFDDYLEMREGLDLVGANFQEFMVSHANKGRVPWYISQYAFWLFSLLLLSWPFRVLIEYQTSYVHFQVIKLFGDNYTTSSNDLCRLSRDSTVDSIDLLNNYTMAPSYSEAVLHDRYPLRTDANIGNQLSQNFNSDKNDESVNRLRTSLSRASLRNGQILYFVSSIPSEGHNNVIRRLSLIDSNDNTAANQPESPPTYEEVVLEGQPSPQTGPVFEMRRSVTSGEPHFFRRLSNHFRRQWNSFGDVQLIANETQL